MELPDNNIPFKGILFKCHLVCFLLLLCSASVFAQEKTIKGTVRSADSVLAGVTVQVKGQSNGTQTDINGRFSIDAPPNSILVFSYVGFQPREIKTGNAATMDVILAESVTNSLTDVIVVGYGSQKKSDITGAVASVPMKDIQKTPANRVDDALQGRVSGLVVQHNDASPDATITIRVRGSNSINGANDPLVVIDGLQGANLNTLAPGDVESIEVLKDASATAIYGSRGANGVVLVTTKKGTKGRAVVSLDALYSVPQVRKKIDLLNPAQYAETVNENRNEFGLPSIFSSSDIEGFKNGGGTDWQDAIFRTGANQNYNLSVNGGNDNTTFYLGGNVVDNKGIILNSSYKRYSLRSNINTKLGQKLTLGVNTFLSREEDHPTALNGFSNGSPIFSALLFAPTKPIYDSSGNYSLPGGGYGPPTNYNPVALAQEPIRNYYTNTTNIFAYLEYTILPGLKINIAGGYQLEDLQNNDYVNSKATGTPGSQTATASIVNMRTITYQNTNQISYEKKIKEHSIKFTGVVEQQYQEYSSSYAGSIGFLTDALTYNDLALGNNPQIPTSSATNRSLLSYMGRLNYGYKDLYLLTLTARADGSSVFGADNKWGYFPSAAIGWNALNENFMQGLRNTFTNLKLRASYGLTGNQAISPYQSLASLNTSLPYSVNGTSLSTGVGLGSIANPNLKWEKTAQLDIGVDMGLLNGRLDISADYYDKKTSDLLLNVPTPEDQGGQGFVLQNVGVVSNKGFEFYLGGRPVASKSITWETGVTFSTNKNKVLALADGQDSITLGDPGLPNFGNTIWLQVGQPIGLFKGYIYEGVWKSSEADKAAAMGYFPGAPKYLDVNNDGKIDNNDIRTIGNAQPKFSFGWNNTVTVKSFDLNVFIQGVQGNSIYNVSRVRFETTSSDADATSIKILNRWSPTNENTDVPSFTGSQKKENLQSSRWLEDGSYVRLKNISLGYTLPSSVSAKIKMSSLRIYVSGTNLVTITKYSGYDPEANTQYSRSPGGVNGADAYAGIDLATYPSQKSFTVGLNIKF
jgi:TonB-linked SusC/RagA family outer membrane protein